LETDNTTGTTVVPPSGGSLEIGNATVR